MGPWPGRAAVAITLVGVALGLVPYRRRCTRPTQRGTDRKGTDHDAGPRMSIDGLGRVVMVIPTYNEVEQPRVDRGADCAPPSPRSTSWSSTTARPTAPARSPTGWPRPTGRSRCCTATEKDGLGAAYLHGFAGGARRGLRRDRRDGRRRLAPARAAAPPAGRRCGSADLVIGSRYVPGGSVVNWPLSRQVLSRGGNLYVRLLLGIRVQDATAGFRLFRRETLEKIDLATVQSTGYVFQTDLVYRAVRAGLRVVGGADRVRRAGPRRLQDERRGRRRVAATDHPLGPARAPRPARVHARQGRRTR